MQFERRGLVKRRMFYKELLPVSEYIVLSIERQLKVVLPCDKLRTAISDVQSSDLLGRIRLVNFNNINIIQ